MLDNHRLLNDELPYFVFLALLVRFLLPQQQFTTALLCVWIGTHIFPTHYRSALIAEDVSDGVQARDQNPLF